MTLDLTPTETRALPVWVLWSAHIAGEMLGAPAVLRACWTARGWMGKA